MMSTKTDTGMERPSFDLQSTYVSYEERRWMKKQYDQHNLGEILKQICRFHDSIQEHQLFSTIHSSSMIKEVHLSKQDTLYYPSALNESSCNKIEQFRLAWIQKFQLVFNDLCTINVNFRKFITIVEGIVFYSAYTAGQYQSIMVSEMRKCLSTFPAYIESRMSEIINMLSYVVKLQISSYITVHTINQNNVGMLFQILPKVKYHFNPVSPFEPIISQGKYAEHTISVEELRYIDYILRNKYPPISKVMTQRKTNHVSNNANTTNIRFTLATSAFPDEFQVYHSLPIIYPYDENMAFSNQYPSFWTGLIGANQNQDPLFRPVSLEPKSDEFKFVQRLFHKTVSEKDANIIFIERIENPHLWEKFKIHRSYMKRKNNPENLNENWLFHGTKSENHHRILAHGFNRSYASDYVLYGRGVYFSRYAHYSRIYSDSKDLSFLLLCRVLVGYHTHGSSDVRTPPLMRLPNGNQIQSDSTTDDKVPYTIVCTFHDDQNYPEYLITYANQAN